MEDLQKALNEKGLKISKLPEKGRCLFTTRDFSPGEVIISQSPYVAVPVKDERSPKSKCEWCFSSSNIKTCSACRVVWYCSSKCQKSDWKLHRVECQALLKVEKERLKFLTPVIRLMVKLCIRRKLENENIFPATITDNYKIVDALVSHMSYVNEKQLASYTEMAELVNSVLQWPVSEISIKEIVENVSKLFRNAHTIVDNLITTRGTGLYPVISLTNHSCSPNSALIFEGRLAVVRAMQHMPKDTEVLTSYIDTAGSTITRQKTLKEKNFFTCSCSRCIRLGEPDDIRETAILEGFRCKDSVCDGFLLPEVISLVVSYRTSDNEGFVCQKCGLVRDKEEISTIFDEVNRISDKASISLFSGHHPFSINLMRTRETLLKILVEPQDWKEALVRCRLMIQISERVYPKCHPLLGLHYYLCGQIEWLVGDMVASIESLKKAWNIFRITHGTDTPFTMEIMTKLEQARVVALFKQMKIES